MHNISRESVSCINICIRISLIVYMCMKQSITYVCVHCLCIYTSLIYIGVGGNQTVSAMTCINVL